MRNPLKFSPPPVVIDTAFGVVGTLSAFAVVGGSSGGPSTIVHHAQTLSKGLTAFGLIIFSVLMIVVSLRAKHHTRDEYMFSILSKSALIGILSAVWFRAMWSLFDEQLGELDGDVTLAGVLLCWSLGYLYTRLRGTRPSA